MGKQEELTARFVNERQRWGDTIIATVVDMASATQTLKAKAEEGELEPGVTYRFLGSWVTHYRWGRQFLASSYCQVQPAGQAGVTAYLRRAPHVGHATAEALWDLFGEDAVRKVREEPDAAAETLRASPSRRYSMVARRFGQDEAREAAAFLAGEAALEGCTIGLMGLLGGKGFPRATMKRALRTWGARAVEMIRRNPYLLLQFPGCGFARTDALYLELGLNPKRLKRQALCLWSIAARDTEGHTWFSAQRLAEELAKQVGSAEVDPIRAAKLGIRARLLSVHRSPECPLPYLTEAGRAAAEANLAHAVGQLLARTPAWPDVAGLDVSEHQRVELARALERPLGIYGGGPGTGKTYSAARLVAELIRIHGQDAVAVVAPTGKAAVRITEALAGYGITLKAKTIHSYLKVQEMSEATRGEFSISQLAGKRGWAFERGPGNPVDQEYVVVDEASMVDLELMWSLVGALPPGGHLLLVGDIQQLPPVGHGAPLRDLLQAGVPAGELTEIRRNSGAIVETCATIRRQEPLDFPLTLDIASGQNLVLRPAASAERAAETILRLVQRIRDAGEHDPVWDVQVIVAVNAKSAVSRAEMNRLLQAELNPARGEGKFWLGDKVVCLKNSFLPADQAMDDVDLGDDAEGYVRVKGVGEGEGTEVYVANGELGKVVGVDPAKLTVRFANPERVVIVPLKAGGEAPGGDGDDSSSVANFDLGYAVSCHKSQGSEWPIVIVALDPTPGARMVCDRSWLYTAISRGKRACVLVGEGNTARAMCRKQKIGHRRTFLVEKIEAEREAVGTAAKAHYEGGKPCEPK